MICKSDDGNVSIFKRSHRIRTAFLLCLVSTACFIATGFLSFSSSFKRIGETAFKSTLDDSEFIRRRGRKNFVDDILSRKIRRRNKLYEEYLQMTNELGRNATRKRRLPDVIGIGAEKCGSGALRWMLLQHPAILTSHPAEMHFFGNKKHNGNMEYYLDHMPEATSYEMVFEKTPSYLTSEGTAKLIREKVPNAKIIVVLCDPVNRTFSDYVQEVRMQNIHKDIKFESLAYQLIELFIDEMDKRGHDADATMDYIYKQFRRYRPSHILSTGLYYYHLSTWIKEFDLSKIHIVNGEELISNPGAALEKVQDFLQLKKLVIQEDFVKGANGFFCYAGPEIGQTDGKAVLKFTKEVKCMPNVSKGRTRLGNWHYHPSGVAVNELCRFYQPYNKKLYRLLNRTFSWQEPLF